MEWLALWEGVRIQMKVISLETHEPGHMLASIMNAEAHPLPVKATLPQPIRSYQMTIRNRFRHIADHRTTKIEVD